MVRFRLAAFARALPALALAACSGGHGSPAPLPSVPTPSPSPTASGSASPTPSVTPSGAPTATPTPVGTATPTPVATATPTPVVTATPTPVATVAPAIVGSLTSLVVCAQQSATCSDDLDAYATSGEEAVVYVKNVSGTLTATNQGGASVATITDMVYKTIGNTSEYEVIYKSATATPATDVLTISDSGSKSSLTIDVRIVAPGSDGGADYFTMSKAGGTVCPGGQVTEAVDVQDGPTVTMTVDNANLLIIGRSGNNPFAIGFLEAGSGVVTATSGNDTIIFPANVPATGFTPTC